MFRVLFRCVVPISVLVMMMAPSSVVVFDFTAKQGFLAVFAPILALPRRREEVTKLFTEVLAEVLRRIGCEIRMMDKD